jgi:uncharacterized protein (DUF433 family)
MSANHIPDFSELDWPDPSKHKPKSVCGRDPWLKYRTSLQKNFDVPFSEVISRAQEEYPTVGIDAEVLGGTPRIDGTRIPIYMILDAVEHYGNLEGALKSYPHLTMTQIKDAVAFAAAVLEHPIDDEP